MMNRSRAPVFRLHPRTAGGHLIAYDTSTSELIRRYPVWLARLANRLIPWTDEFCGAECGYPVTGRLRARVDVIDDLPVYVVLCSLHGPCAASLEQPVFTQRYLVSRPLIVRHAARAKADGNVEVVLHLGS